MEGIDNLIAQMGDQFAWTLHSRTFEYDDGSTSHSTFAVGVPYGLVEHIREPMSTFHQQIMDEHPHATLTLLQIGVIANMHGMPMLTMQGKLADRLARYLDEHKTPTIDDVQVINHKEG